MPCPPAAPERLEDAAGPAWAAPRGTPRARRPRRPARSARASRGRASQALGEPPPRVARGPSAPTRPAVNTMAPSPRCPSSADRTCQSTLYRPAATSGSASSSTVGSAPTVDRTPGTSRPFSSTSRPALSRPSIRSSNHSVTVCGDLARPAPLGGSEATSTACADAGMAARTISTSAPANAPANRRSTVAGGPVVRIGSVSGTADRLPEPGAAVRRPSARVGTAGRPNAPDDRSVTSAVARPDADAAGPQRR